MLLAGMCLWALRAIFLAAGYYFHFWGVRRHHLEAAFFGLVVFGVAFASFDRKERPPEVTGVGWLSVRTKVFAAAAALVTTAVLYYPALGLGFLSDDYVLWRRALTHEFIAPTAEFFRPLPLVIWRAAAALNREPASTLHAVNILLHGLNTFLVFRLAGALGFSVWQAAVSAAAFMVWPTNVEAVAWCSGIQDVLMATFVLSAMTAPLWPYRTPVTAVVFVLLLLAAVATKETAVISPVLFTVLWLGRTRAALFIKLAATVALVAVVVRLQLGLPGGYVTPPDRYLLKELASRLASGLVMPMRAATIERFPQLAVATVAGVIVISVCAFWKWSDDSAGASRAARGAMWALISILPVYRYFFIGPDLEGSRYLYLASFGWAVLLVQLVSAALAVGTWRRTAAIVVCGAVIVPASAYSRRQFERWKSAGMLRDAVLASARDTALQSNCPALALEGLPDSIDGVYVFRNGFYDAVAIEEQMASVRARIAPTAGCAFVWRNGNFVAR
ncbi:MAG: hypothetical protein ACRD1S_00015 [Vicinamibacterales bacterium]